MTTFPPESRSDRPERAVLVAVLRPDADTGELAEMRELLATAGAEVVGEVVQHRSAPDAKTYIGSGKVEELRALCKQRLRRYEYPHVVEFVDELPRTLTGKVQRFRLRELAEERSTA